MRLVMDDDVQRVCEFMQASLPTAKLVAVADGLASLAPLLWGAYQGEAVAALRLLSEPISGCDRHRPRDATEPYPVLPCVGADDPAAEAGGSQ